MQRKHLAGQIGWHEIEDPGAYRESAGSGAVVGDQLGTPRLLAGSDGHVGEERKAVWHATKHKVGGRRIPARLVELIKRLSDAFDTFTVSRVETAVLPPLDRSSFDKKSCSWRAVAGSSGGSAENPILGGGLGLRRRRNIPRGGLSAKAEAQGAVEMAIKLDARTDELELAGHKATGQDGRSVDTDGSARSPCNGGAAGVLQQNIAQAKPGLTTDAITLDDSVFQVHPIAGEV